MQILYALNKQNKHYYTRAKLQNAGVMVKKIWTNTNK